MEDGGRTWSVEVSCMGESSRRVETSFLGADGTVRQLDRTHC